MKLDNAGRCHDAASRRLACEAGPRAIRAALAENDISFSVLPDLTDQDLKDIGVSLGHRRQLRREIANLDKTAAAQPSTPSLTAPSIAAPAVAPRAEAATERRHAGLTQPVGVETMESNAGRAANWRIPHFRAQ